MRTRDTQRQAAGLSVRLTSARAERLDGLRTQHYHRDRIGAVRWRRRTEPTPRCAMAPAADRITKIANGGRPAAGPGRHALLAAPLVAALLGGLTAAPLAATGDLYQVIPPIL